MNRRGMHSITALFYLIVILAAIAGGVLSYIEWLDKDGAKYEASITVTTFEISSRKYPHTYIWTDQTVSAGDNGGMESKRYLFAGIDQPFEVGKTYHVKWHNERRFHIFDFWYLIGVIDSIEEV